MVIRNSEYQSPNTVGKRQTIPMDVNDPRLRWDKKGQTKARLGAEIDIVNFAGENLVASVTGFNTISSILQQQVANINTSLESLPQLLQDPKLFPTDILNLAAAWSGTDLQITWDFDTTNPQNQYLNHFVIKFTISGTDYIIKNYAVNRAGTLQSYTLTLNSNFSLFGLAQTSFDTISVAGQDAFNNTGNYASIPGPAYNSGLPAPDITVTAINNGYSVTVNNIPTAPNYNYIEILEYVSTASSEPTGVTYQEVYLSTVNPASIIVSDTSSRWVKARFTDKLGSNGDPYSAAQKVTPNSPVSVDLQPPNEVASASATWSGDNIIVTYALPSTDPGVRFQIALTSANSNVGYFYVFPQTSSGTQTATISKADLLTQFGTHYSSFSGVIKSIDSSDNRSAGVSFNTGTRANPLTGVIPTFKTTPLVNGYSVSFTLPQYAVYAEVYQKFTSWSGVTSPIDSFTGTYASGGAKNSTTLTLSVVLDVDGNTVSSIPTGYIINGLGIPDNTYITAVSGNQITLSNALTSQASGTYTANALVYSGVGPASITSTLYQDTYLLVHFYDDFDNPSSVSAEQITQPISPTSVTLTGPGNVSGTGMSTSQGIDSSGTLGFNGYINLSWNAVSDTNLRGYRIRYTTDSTNPVYTYATYPIDQTNPPSGTLSYKLTGLAVGATYKLAIATYDQYNNISTSFTSFANTTISGTPAVSNYISAGNFKFGYGVNGSSDKGLYFDTSNYWYIDSTNSARLKVGGPSSNYLLWDGSAFTIDGNITARGGSFSGNVQMSSSGASIYNGDVTTSPGTLTGDGFILNSGGLIIRKGTNQVSLDTTTGGITANYGSIAGWDITASKIEKLATKYAGLSPSGTYAFWAGSTAAGGDTTQFAVDRSGKVYATSVQISGGQLDIGATSSNLTSGFHVTSAGLMYATGATIDGNIKAQSGTFVGDVQITTGSLYTGVSGTKSSVVINSSGLAAYDATVAGGNATTQILTNAAANGATFITSAATIGGFNIDSSSIKNSAGTLAITSTTSAGDRFTIKDSAGTWQLGLAIPSAGTDKIIYAGQTGTPNFYVTAAGTLNATGAIISGKLTIDDPTATINGVSASVLTSQASAGATALQPNGTLTGSVSGSATINGYSAATVVSGAAYGGTAMQPGGGVQVNPGRQISALDSSSGLIIVGTGTASWKTITSATTSGANVTYTTSAAHGYSTGDILSIAGSTNTTFNAASVSVNFSTTNTFTVTLISAPSGLFSGTASVIVHKQAVVLNSTGLAMYDSSGTKKVAINSDGSAVFTGAIFGGSKGSTADTSNPGYAFGSDLKGTFSIGSSTGYIQWDGTKIRIFASSTQQSGTANTYDPNNPSDLGQRPATIYTNPARIDLNSATLNGLGLYGLPVQGNADIVYRSGGYNPSSGTYTARLALDYSTSLYPLGPMGRQRMVVEDPVTGVLMLGMAIYYQDTSDANSSQGTPTSSSGSVGDLWVRY